MDGKLIYLMVSGVFVLHLVGNIGKLKKQHI